MFKLLAALFLTITAGIAQADTTRVAIGVLVRDGELNARERWLPTADYLIRKIPQYHFVIVPLDREGMRQAVAQNKLDFLLTDPGQYVELAAADGIASLATMTHAWQGETYAESSAVIITRADRQDILRLSHLKGKSFMAVSPDAFAGFQLIRLELKSHDIDPFRDFNLRFGGPTPEDVVYAVRNGSVDAATVRAGVLEHMAMNGTIDLKEFRVLHPHNNPGFPFAASTEAYPGWAFARAWYTPDDLTWRVAHALQTMPANDPATRANGYAGWIAPLDYQSVRELVAGKHVCPYEDTVADVIWNFVRQYQRWLIAGVAFLLFSSGFTAYMLRMNSQLRHSKRSLENEIAERARADQALRRSENALRELHDITATHSLPFAGKAQALLALGCQQFGLPVGILSHVEGEVYRVVEVIPVAGPIPKGSVFPLGFTYCRNTLQSDEPVCFEHAAQSEWSKHPAYDQCKLEAYIGIRVEVQGEVYGTLNFVSPEPHATTFTNSDREILKLMAQWLGDEIERQRAEAQRRMLSAALEQTADAVMIVNRSGLFEYVNPAFERITGYNREEVVGKSPKLLRSGRHGDEFYRRVWKTILRGEAFHDTFINRRKDGSLYYEEKTITPLKDSQGNVVHFVSTGKDVTKRRLAEERARQRQAELAHVGRVSAMGEMATVLAHELNQPLAAIVNYAQGCIRRLCDGETDSNELLAALEHIVTQGHRSGEIIRRQREFLRKGKPLRTRSDINHIVCEAMELASLEARQKNVALRLELCDGLPLVLADAIQIEQVVLNLVHNAIEAIDEAGSPRREVVVQTACDPKNGAEVTVRDSGPGLPVEKADLIFEAFFSTKPSGMGMGLSISRSIVEAHGDQLRALPSADGGAVFRFALPAVEAGTLQ